MYIKETFVNETKGHIFGEGNWTEADVDTLGELYRSLRSEYGACVSKQYVDRVNAPPIQTGWVFRKRMQYDDSKETYFREVWVSVSLTEPQKRTVNVKYPWDAQQAS